MSSNIKNKTSPTWKYFTIVAEDETKVMCNICEEKISRGGKIPKHFNTSSMLSHLKSKHFNAFRKISSDNKKKGNGSTRSNTEIVEIDEQIAGPSHEIPLTRKKQITLQNILERKEKWKPDHEKSLEITNAIGEMIAGDIQPLSIVDYIGFRRLLNIICSKYEVPSRKYMTEKVIPSIYDKLKSKIKEEISKAKYISLTTDIWTATAKNSSFISITGHFLDENFTQYSRVLRVMPFEGTHTGTKISEYILSGLESMDINVKKVHLVLRDNAANMKAGIRESGMESVGCFIHSLQLCINNSILSQQAVASILSICRKTATHFHHSPSACDKLKDVQKRLKKPEHTLKQDISTRWNSTYYMLESYYEQRQSLLIYESEHKGITTLTPIQYDLVNKLIALLKPFEEATKTLSERNATIALIIPTILILNVALSIAEEELSGIKTTITELKREMKERFNCCLIAKTLCLSTFLDPRFKLKFQSKEISEEKFKEWLREACKDDMEQKSILDSDSPNSTENEGVGIVAEKGNPSATRSFSDYYNIFMTRTRNKDDARELEAIASLPETVTSSSSVLSELSPRSRKRAKKLEKLNSKSDIEFDKYISSPVLERNLDPFSWWKVKKATFPTLQNLALRYLSAPPSSVESERLFSTGGNIYQPKRSNLTTENGEKLMFMHYNLKILNFDY